jgi:hypothetical protein
MLRHDVPQKHARAHVHTHTHAHCGRSTSCSSKQEPFERPFHERSAYESSHNRVRNPSRQALNILWPAGMSPPCPAVHPSVSVVLSFYPYAHARARRGDTHIACHFLGCKPFTNPYTTALGDAETRTNHGLARVTRAYPHAPLTRLTTPS